MSRPIRLPRIQDPQLAKKLMELYMAGKLKFTGEDEIVCLSKECEQLIQQLLHQPA